MSEVSSTSIRPEPEYASPEAIQLDEGNYRIGRVLRSAIKAVSSTFRFYVIYRGNKIAYLRHLGTRIGSNCVIKTSVKHFGSEPWLVQLGDRVRIAAGVYLLTHDGSSRVFRHLISGASIYGNVFDTVQIHDNCVIGVNAIVLPGVEIGPNSIVGSGSVVTRDVPPNSVAAGVPARVVCSLDNYVAKYKTKMISIESVNREDLRKELTQKLWGEVR